MTLHKLGQFVYENGLGSRQRPRASLQQHRQLCIRGHHHNEFVDLQMFNISGNCKPFIPGICTSLTTKSMRAS